jgi:hypothetical protein
MVADEGAAGSGQAANACFGPVGVRPRKLTYLPDPAEEVYGTSSFVLAASGYVCNLLFHNDSAKVGKQQGAAGRTRLTGCGRSLPETGHCRAPVSRAQSRDNNNPLKGKSVRQRGVVTPSSAARDSSCVRSVGAVTAAGPISVVNPQLFLLTALAGGSAHASREAGHAA